MPVRKSPLYIASRRPPQPSAAPAQAAAAEAPTPAPAAARRVSGWRRHWPIAGWVALGMLLSLLVLLALPQAPRQRPVTQAQIDAAVRHSLQKEPLPSVYAKAYQQIAPSVVRVVGLMDEEEDALDRPDKKAMDRSLGTGVVIKDDGTILTNLHVVNGAKRLRVTFANGHESDAVLIGLQPENDLAVIKPTDPPDEVEPATMRSTGDLMPGDEVIAVGHPFGIGPSVSGGVVSGLRREFRAPEDRKSTRLNSSHHSISYA